MTPVKSLLTAILLTLASLAVAATGDTQNADLKLVGEARLKVMFWSVYDSRLYTETGDYAAGQRPLRLEIEYLRDIRAERLIQQTRDEWNAMGRDHPQQSAWLERLGTLWPNIRAGDVLVLQLTDDDSATFYYNGERLGAIEDAAFGQQFADIWLSPECTRPELRLALLGRED